MLSREDVGILLSFARYPEVITEEWTQRLGAGVDKDELRELFRLAGLPWSSARGIIGADASDGDQRTGGEAGSRFWRATLGTIVILTLLAVVSLIGVRGLTLEALSIAVGFVLCGIVLFKTIDRLSSGMH